MPDEVALRLVGVGKSTRDGQAVLRDISVEVPACFTVAVMGANGAGKSTLLDLACGLTVATAGRVEVFGCTPRQAVRRGLLGGMLQSGGLLPELTVGETIDLFTALHRRPPVGPGDLDPVLQALAGRRVGACSGGEQQRLKWALATLPDPRLLVLDEPTAGMDWQARHDFWGEVRDRQQQGATVVYATHYADEVDGIADLVLHLETGRVIGLTTPDDVRAAGNGDPGASGLFSGLAALRTAATGSLASGPGGRGRGRHR